MNIWHNDIGNFAIRTLARLSRLLRDIRGQVAIMFALGLIPMLGTLGLAVDYSRYMALRSTAQTAADSAALFAAKIVKDGLYNAKGSKGLEASVLADAKKRADALFSSYVKNATSGIVVGSTTVTRTGQKISASVAYSISLPTTIGGVLGLDKLSGSSTSDTISGLPLFIDVHLLLDNSQSMGIGANQTEMLKLYAASAPHNCVFGCHVPESGSGPSNEAIATAKGIKLRIDVLRDAAKDMVQQAKDDMAQGGFYRFALYTMSYNFKTLAALSDDLSYVSTQTAKIALGYNDVTGFGDSDFNLNIPQALTKITTNGDGLSQSTAKSYVFIVSDGSGDVKGNGCTFGHCMSVVDTKLCKAYKDKGATVGVIYTTYTPIKANPANPNDPTLDFRYTGLVQPIAAKIPVALKACASDGWYFEATDDAALRAAMTKLFTQINLPPTLTN